MTEKEIQQKISSFFRYDLQTDRAVWIEINRLIHCQAAQQADVFRLWQFWRRRRAALLRLWRLRHGCTALLRLRRLRLWYRRLPLFRLWRLLPDSAASLQVEMYFSASFPYFLSVFPFFLLPSPGLPSSLQTSRRTGCRGFCLNRGSTFR